MNSFWDCDRLFFEDLPTVRDLIWNADWDILSREIAGGQSCDGADSETIAARAALEQMMELDIRKSSMKWVFLPFEYYSVGATPGTIERQLDAALICRKDFKTIEGLSIREKLLFSADDCRRHAKREVKRLGNSYPDLHSWMLSSWGKVLSFRAWMRGDYSRKERYQALASIVREMMFFGSTREEVARRQRATKKRLKHDMKSLDKGGLKTSPAELLLRNYGLESTTDDYQSEYDNRLRDTVLVLNHNVSVDLHRRVADLAKRIKRAEKSNGEPTEFSFSQW